MHCLRCFHSDVLKTLVPATVHPNCKPRICQIRNDQSQASANSNAQSESCISASRLNLSALPVPTDPEPRTQRAHIWVRCLAHSRPLPLLHIAAIQLSDRRDARPRVVAVHLSYRSIDSWAHACTAGASEPLTQQVKAHTAHVEIGRAHV